MPQARLRELSPIVFEVAGGGDLVARSIIDRLADELVVMAGAIIRRLLLTRRRPDIVLAGGVFATQDQPFLARIGDGVEAIAPGATVHRSEALPVLGAALLGLDWLDGVSGADRHLAETHLRDSLGSWRPDGERMG